MAEAAGLVLSGIALASLVTTCVEFVEYFEDGCACMRDVNLAVTKVNLMKARLTQLGDLENTVIPLSLLDASAAPDDWQHVAKTLPEGASGIKEIIQRTTKLCKRYCHDGMPETSRARKCTIAAQSSSHQLDGRDSFGESPPAGRRAIYQSVKRSVSWALHDKKKFNGLIADFDFILSNLEKIIEGFDTKTYSSQDSLAMSTTKSDPSKKAGARVGPETGSSASDARGQGPPIVQTTSFTRCQAYDQAVHFVGGQQDRDDERTKLLRETRTRFDGNLGHDQSFTVSGHVDGSTINGMAALWQKLAMESMRQQSQAKATIDFANDSDLFPPTSHYLHHRDSASGSLSSTSTGTPDRERAPITYPNYYDYSENDPPTHDTNQQPPPLQQPQKNGAMANMAMQVPIQQQQGQGRLVDNSRPNQNSQRSPEDSVFPPNKVDLDAARYRQTQQRRNQAAAKENRPSTNSSGTGSAGRPSSSGIGGAPGNPNPGRPASPESPMLSPGAAHIQRLPTPSLAMSVLQPLDAKVIEYGTLMAEAQGEMARLDDEMRQLQERQREVEARFLEAKSRHDEYRRQYQDVERALRGDLVPGGMGGMSMGMAPGMRDGGGPPVPSGPQQMGGGGQHQQHQQMDGGRMGPGPGPGPGQHRPAMASQRTVSAHSEPRSMMSQDSVRTQKKGRFSRIFGV
ncbi:hypothetical protein VP1G_06399 [Cytospora mali]|uniref:Prion-inhibition and propagation HeLo domain-containing protein n=1 Tax=Cytospora mali TaxID=578113 RepID=A0A194V5A9_CYTMA|nr:hypothetical protein VP1G_06399 [Valsa mali var. pyri (nom. inval.)]